MAISKLTSENQTNTVFNQEGAFKSVVCKISAILPQPKCVKYYIIRITFTPTGVNIIYRHFSIHQLAYIIKMVADDLAPNRHQTISNHHDDLTVKTISNKTTLTLNMQGPN